MMTEDELIRRLSVHARTVAPAAVAPERVWRDLRRRQTVRRTASVGAVLAIAAAAFVAVPDLRGGHPNLTANLAMATNPDEAEIAATADCLAEDVVNQVLQDMGADLGQSSAVEAGGRLPAPRPGDIPDDFEAVAVVICREAGPDRTHGDRVVYEEARLEGDVDAVIAALTRTSPTLPHGSSSCTFIYMRAPAIFLVDADGRAVRPQVPSDSCGHPSPDVLQALGALTETEVIQY